MSVVSKRWHLHVAVNLQMCARVRWHILREVGRSDRRHDDRGAHDNARSPPNHTVIHLHLNHMQEWRPMQSARTEHSHLHLFWGL